MSSALDKARELNQKNITASITFLSDNVFDKAKARYVTTTYTELIRRIARAGINAGVQIPLEQAGANIEDAVTVENLTEIINAGNKYGVFVWAEVNDGRHGVISKFSGSKGFGIAFSDDLSNEMMKNYKTFRSMKVIYQNYAKKPIKKNANVPSIGKGKHFVFSSIPDHMLWQTLKGKGKNESNLTFEFRLGYSNSKLKRVMKKGAKVSMLIPFGKDWMRYAMNNVPEGYMRFLAGRLISKKESGV